MEALQLLPLCECGCGMAVNPKRNHNTNMPTRFVQGHHNRLPENRASASVRMRSPEGQARQRKLADSPARKKRAAEAMSKLRGPNAPGWKGGKPWVDRHGYVMVYDGERRIPQHRLVMEGMIGRKLLPGEVVHHVNENPADNRPENLWLFPNKPSHQAWHAKFSMPAVPIAKEP